MAQILGQITLNGRLELEVSANPATGAGTPAPVGSTATVSDGSGFFLKTGAADTAWTLILSDGSTEVSATADATTVSTTDVLMTGMTITPVAGTYLVIFSASLGFSTGNLSVPISIYSGGVQKADSVRNANPGNAIILGITFTPATQQTGTQGVVTVNGAQAIDIRWKTSAGTATVHQRTLNILRIG